MAELLKDQFGEDVPEAIASQLKQAHPPFNKKEFIKYVIDGYETLSLTERSKKIAQGMKIYLPEDFDTAMPLILASIDFKPNGKNKESSKSLGMGSFILMPHLMYIAEQGLDSFETSMHAQYILTQRFTAEFSIRPFIEKYPEKTMVRLKKWSKDPSEHVRRLVSEGTRPRLPWASRLKEFQKDPSVVIDLLELLKDDPELYVRRSVANNLNDISKDNPKAVAKVAKKWLKGASKEREWIIKHALRSAVKRGEPWALEVLGFGDKADVEISEINISPKKATIGKHFRVQFDLQNSGNKSQALMVDFKIHYIKANGKANPKVFKLKSLTLVAGEQLSFSKKVSLAEMSTRKHYPGVHKVEVVVNGAVYELGEFELAK